MKSKSDLLQGTLDMLILKTLALEPLHGWGLSQSIRQMSDEVLQVNQGSHYPALHRLEPLGLLDTYWGTSENNRQAKYYRLTATSRAAIGIGRFSSVHQSPVLGVHPGQTSRRSLWAQRGPNTRL